jgi:hypothetical protein
MKGVPICRSLFFATRVRARSDSPNVFALRAPQDEDEPRPDPSIASNCSQSKNSLCGRGRCPCAALAARVSRYSQITNTAALGTVGLHWQVGRFRNFSSRGTSDMISAMRTPARSRSTTSPTIKAGVADDAAWVRITSTAVPPPSWPGLCRPSTSLLVQDKEVVDARHKAGHDEAI